MHQEFQKTIPLQKLNYCEDPSDDHTSQKKKAKKRKKSANFAEGEEIPKHDENVNENDCHQTNSKSNTNYHKTSTSSIGRDNNEKRHDAHTSYTKEANKKAKADAIISEEGQEEDFEQKDPYLDHNNYNNNQSNTAFPESSLQEDNVYEEVSAEQSRFRFSLPVETWNSIKPETKKYSGQKQRIVRKLTENWTKSFSDSIKNSHPGCVLAFKAHHVKSAGSRKIAGPFFSAKAVCKGGECSAQFQFTINMEPASEENVEVFYTVSGKVKHNSDEVNRRNLTGDNRSKIAELIKETSTSDVYYQNYVHADPEQLEQGNYSSVHNPSVLRKIVSEVVQKEYLHSNIMTELQMLKESYSNDQYIQDIGLDPFSLILFSEAQVRLAKQLSSENALSIYLDSTGSVINHIKGQKRPFLFSMVVKPIRHMPAISICDMISTQHTIPRIELMLGSLKRAVAKEGARLKVKKIETDFSLANIQACLIQFSNCSLKVYLAKCFDICAENKDISELVCLHICSAHATHTFIRNLKKHSKLAKSTRRLAITAFAALVNCGTLAEAEVIYEDICTTFLSRNKTSSVESAVERIQSHKCQEPEDEDLVTQCSSIDEDEVESLTIKEGSGFTYFFQSIRQGVEELQTAEKHEFNDHYNPDLIRVLEAQFMATFPLRSGILLRLLSPDEEGVCTRDTNEAVENWFKFLKEDLKLKHMRPATFTIRLRAAIDGRLKEKTFQGGRKPKTKTQSKKRKMTEDTKLEIEKEVWKKKSKKTEKPKYHPSVKTKITLGILPKVMKWGGKQQNIYLSNTCPIDNCLTALHVYSLQHKNFMGKLQSHEEEVYKTLASVLTLMNEEDFCSAKLLWANFIEHRIEQVTDLHGGEYDSIFKYISQCMTSRIVSACDQPDCPCPVENTKEEKGGITCGIEEQFHSVQYLVDKWLSDDTPCGRRNPDLSDSSDDDETCKGKRHITRFVSPTPVIVVRVYEHGLYGKIQTSELLESRELIINGHVYKMAGLTFHREDHYCATVIFKETQYWYDGLGGKLATLPENLDTWFPSHAIFCAQ